MTAPPAEIALLRVLHDEAVRADKPGYMDPHSGLMVLTSAYLRRRPACCGSGCRHCPWPLDAQDRAGRPAGALCLPFP